MLGIEEYRPKIIEICRSLPIKHLSLFGSALSESFALESDVDVLVLFDNREEIDLFNVYFQLKESLEEVFHRTVDIVIEKKIQNPYFRQSIEATKEIIYER